MNKFSKNVFAHDSHFNLFYSYSIGGKEKMMKYEETEDILKEKNKKQREILEDNLTRAFLITLGSLSPKLIRTYFNVLFSTDIPKIEPTKNIDIDLQNVDPVNKELSEKIKDRNINKLLLVISDLEPKLTKKDLLTALNNFNGNDKGRPDGWVICDELVIVIEAKIKSNPVDQGQLVRHLHTNFGKDNIDENNFEFVKRSWKQILAVFNNEEFVNQYKNDFNDINNIFIQEFKDVLMKTGQILNLSFITDKDQGYSKANARIQFPLLLEAFDQKLKGTKFGFELKRAKRPKTGHLWELYEIKSLNKIINDPHYSFYFDIDGAGIGLTIRNRLKTRLMKLINEEGEKNLISFISNVIDRYRNQNSILLSRYSISLINYRNIDNKPGQIHADQQDTFKLEINFHEILRRKRERDIQEFLEGMTRYCSLAKQLEISFKILYPDVNKIDDKTDFLQIRNENKKLFEDYDNLLGDCIKFIDDTKAIINTLIRV